MADDTNELKERFTARYEVIDSGCWQWQRARSSAGYGQIWCSGKVLYAHVVSYLLHKGDIQEGFEIDHLCENPGCVNPDHLEAVTHQVNSARGNLKKRQTHCNRGHPLAGDNLGIAPAKNARYCKACSSLNAVAWNRKHRARHV